MGWRFKWVSSHGNDFNFDYHVSATDEEKAKGKMYYNYETEELMSDEMPACVCFTKRKTAAFSTLIRLMRGGSIYWWGTYNFLDLVPKGRNENPGSTMDWVRHHDRYYR
jgi:predicted dithiol-disulfide oxidoreductase (DUF899 family)